MMIRVSQTPMNPRNLAGQTTLTPGDRSPPSWQMSALWARTPLTLYLLGVSGRTRNSTVGRRRVTALGTSLRTTSTPTAYRRPIVTKFQRGKRRVIRGTTYPITAALPPPPLSPDFPTFSPTAHLTLKKSMAHSQRQRADVTA